MRNSVLRYANWGVFIHEWRIDTPTESFTDGFTLENSTIAYMDTQAIRLLDQWNNGSAVNSFTQAGILNTVIRNNEMHHLGFRCDADNNEGILFTVRQQAALRRQLRT